MAKIPYMRFYPSDYFDDTAHLTCLQHGIYLQLITRYFMRGGPLPDDDNFLARTVGVGPREWARNKPVIAAFFQVDRGAWFHRRVSQELTHVTSKSLKARAARLTNVARPLDERGDERPTITDNRCQITEGSSEPSIESAKADSCAEAEKTGEPGEKYTAPFERFWAAYPNKTGKREASRSYQNAFVRLGGAKAGAEAVHGKLLASVEAFAAALKRKPPRDARFIPHAATWLNQGRYDDLLDAGALAPKPDPYAGVELSPADPLPARKAAAPAKPAGWVPDENG